MNTPQRSKEICDSFGFINVSVDEDEMKLICLGGLAQSCGQIQTTICIREKSLSFFELQSMLLIEENHTGVLTSTHADNKMLYTETDWPRGRGHGERGRSAHANGNRHEQNQRNN